MNPESQRLDDILAAEDAYNAEMALQADQNAITAEEAEEAIADYHRVFLGSKMGSTIVADSVWQTIA